jgi:peroxiredoxin
MARMTRPLPALLLSILLLGCPSEPRAPARPEPVSVSVPVAKADPAPAPVEEGDGEDQGAPGGARAEAAPGSAPAFSLDSLNGAGKATVARGKVTVVHFWATWCAPCKVSFPKLQELYAKYKSEGLVVIGLSVDDDPSEIAAFAAATGVRFPVAWDKEADIAKQFQLKMMPSTILIDRAGVIRVEHAGYTAGDDAEIEAEVKRLF